MKLGVKKKELALGPLKTPKRLKQEKKSSRKEAKKTEGRIVSQTEEPGRSSSMMKNLFAFLNPYPRGNHPKEILNVGNGSIQWHIKP